jgi:putative membrane protein
VLERFMQQFCAARKHFSGGAMRQRCLVLFAAFLVTAALACKKNETYTSDTSTTSTTASDTSGTTSTYDTSGTSATTGTNAAMTSAMDPADSDFMMKAAQGGLAEVDMGNMASSKATNADVKKFGDRMVTDHSKANDELKQLASTKGVTLPADVGDEHKKAMDEMSAKSGKDFDKAYMDDMVKDHEKDVAEFEKASKEAKDADLKAWATKTLPTLQGHLKMAKETQKKVK